MPPILLGDYMVEILETAWSFLFHGATNELVVLICGVFLSALALAFVCRLIKGRG